MLETKEYRAVIDQKAAYLRTQVLTARPEQLTLMLLDGAIRFAERARKCLRESDYEGSFNALTRSEDIVLELVNSMKPESAPEICKQQASLYMFVYSKLVEANMGHEEAAVGDALRVLGLLRETWLMLMDQLQDQAVPSREPMALNSAGGRVSIQG